MTKFDCIHVDIRQSWTFMYFEGIQLFKVIYICVNKYLCVQYIKMNAIHWPSSFKLDTGSL